MAEKIETFPKTPVVAQQPGHGWDMFLHWVYKPDDSRAIQPKGKCKCKCK
jgi:hypothetical protein